MIKLFVFDMAGTTVNEDNLVYKTIRKAVEKGGYPCTLNLVLEIGAGKEKRKAIRDLLMEISGEAPKDDIDAIFSDFKESLKKAYHTSQIQPVDHAEEMFDYLREQDCQVCINTGYNRRTAHTLMKKLGWSVPVTVDMLVTDDDVPKGRPNPDMILLAMEQAGVSDPAQVAKIGDSGIDIVEGQRAGCSLVLGITTGAQNREQLMAAKPTAVVDSLLEIKNFLD